MVSEVEGKVEGENEAVEETVVDDLDMQEPVRDATVAVEMAELTHEQVRGSEPFQGVLAELKATREEIKALKEAAAAAESQSAYGEGDDVDVFTRGDVRKIVDSEITKLRGDIDRTARTVRQQAFQHGLDTLRAEQMAGKIPSGVNTDALMKQAVAELRQTEPEVLASLMSKPDAVRRIWRYAGVSLPSIAEAVTKAGKATSGAVQERLARGELPEGGDTAANIDDFIAVLDSQ